MRFASILIFIMGFASTAWAGLEPVATVQQNQSLDQIKVEVGQFVEHEISGQFQGRTKVEVGYIDPRMQLVACDKPIEIYQPYQVEPLRISSVGVKCSGQFAWNIYVPVKIQAYATAVIASKPLYLGAKIDNRDVSVAEVDISRIQGNYFQNVNEVLGKVITRNVSAGQAISERQIDEPMLVKKGEPVMIVGQMKGLTVSMPGKALQDGKMGETIQVENTHSKRVVDASVAAQREVHAILPTT